MVFKIADIKQTEAETVWNYFGRILKTIADLKAKINPEQFVVPDLVLPAEQAGAWTTLPNETKALICLDLVVYNSDLCVQKSY